MGTKTAIEWTEATWNPATGCTPQSPGCHNCYAQRLALRLKAMGQPNYRNGFVPTLHPHMLERPLQWKKPAVIFVNSMSDLFHRAIPDAYIARVFDTMRSAHWHRFQILTKRADRLAVLATQLDWPINVMAGVTIEADAYCNRANQLRSVPAAAKFLSLEPLLGPLPHLDITGIDWVIVGGESGPRSRPMEEDWITPIRDLCQRRNIPFFFKQWGGVNKKKAGKHLQGKLWLERPTFLEKTIGIQQELIA